MPSLPSLPAFLAGAKKLELDLIIKPLHQIESSIQDLLSHRSKEVEENKTQVTTLLARNNEIEQETSRALKISTNIRNLLGLI
jgi:hypothetical protein